MLDEFAPWLTTDAGSFAFWTSAKVALWVAPSMMLVRWSGRSLRDVMSIRRPGACLTWGAGSGLAIALVAIVPRWLSGRSPVSLPVDFATVNALVVAPLLEEFFLRGAVLGNFKREQPFARANAGASLLFLGLHLPGWFFMGTLSAQLLTPMGGALSIVVLGLVFGYVAHRSHTVVAAIIAHALNNLASLG
ncbi:MAG: CPBP family intramembrane glutamic endopeptidase [Vicinamibacterales bacterium]